MTRMWLGVDPSHLCDQHLLGEHAELHQEVGTWLRHPHGPAVVRGHVERGQVVPSAICSRHAALVSQMELRGMTHDSPLEAFDADAMPSADGDVTAANRRDLRERCDDCAARMGVVV